MPSPHPLASFVIDSGQVGKEAVSASYSTLAVDAPRITLAPSRPLIYYFKPNTFSKKKKNCPFGPVVLLKGQRLLYTTEVCCLEKLGIFRRAWNEKKK